MPWSKALRPRRILASLCITAALLVGTVGAAGYESHDLPAAGPLPASWRMPEARVGDRGEYTWDSVRIDPATQQAVVLASHELWGFEWLEPKPTRGHDGRLHDTNRLHEWGWQVDRDTGEWERYAEPVYAIDRHDQGLVSYAYLSAVATDESQRYGGAHMLQAHLIAPGERFSIHCGPVSPLHGQEVPLEGEAELFGDCSWGNKFSGPTSGFSAVGTQELGELQAILFSRASGQAHLWYDPGIPYPARVAVQDRSDPSRYDVVRLQRFQRGAGEPITWDGAPAGAPAEPWEMRPLVGGTLDESGIEHPFPASKAIEAARADVEGSDFDRLLDAGGYLSFADYREHHDERRDLHMWDLTATYDGAAASVAVTRETTKPEPSPPVPPAGPLPPVPVPLPPLPPGSPPAQALAGNTTTKVAATGDRGGGPWPREAPADGPTVASAWARWRAFASDEYRDRAPNAWGFRILCLNGDGGCSPYREVWAGVRAGYVWSNGTASESVNHESILEESENALRGREARLHESTYRWSGSTQVPSAQNEPPVPTAGDMRTLHTVAWVMPATAVVAGTGLVAFLAGLAYLLWPALKSGGLTGLFSRVHGRTELLEHPQRQRMVQLVEAQPGIHVSELGRRLGLGRNQLDHHLRKLQASGVVKLIPSGGYTCVFLAASADHAVMAAAGAVKAEGARRVLELALAHPGISVREVARQAGLSPGTVAHHLRRLREAGLVGEWGPGLAATERGRKVLS